jgi:hypothetical protein
LGFRLTPTTELKKTSVKELSPHEHWN